MHRQPTHEEISRRAQALWAQRGQPSGQDDEIWLEAERQLAAEAATSVARAAATAPAPSPAAVAPIPAPAPAAPRESKDGSKSSAKKRGGKGR